MSERTSFLNELRQRLTVSGLKAAPLRIYIGLIFFLWLVMAPTLGQMDTLAMLQWTTALFFVMFVISWDFVVGYTGQVSFGHTLFFAAGGYTTAILNLEFGIDPLLGVLIGTIVATVAGLLYAIPALRIEGHYLALFTLLPPIILLSIFTMYRDFTGGSRGLPNPDPLFDRGGFVENAEIHYYITVALFIGIFMLAWIITRSDTGKIFTAIRESEDAVSSAGFNPAKFKVYSMLMSAGIGGFAGAVFVHTPGGSASPTQLLELVVMIEILLAAIIGGFGTITGAVVGGLLIYWGLEYFAGSGVMIPGTDVAVGDVHLLLFFSVLLVVLYVLAEGVVPWSIRQGTRIKLLARGEDPSQVDGSDGNPWFERQLAGIWQRRTGNNTATLDETGGKDE